MLCVIADDFSGAAELGGIAVRHGLKARIYTSPLSVKKIHDDTVYIFDTDTRRLNPTSGIYYLEQWLSFIHQNFDPQFIFKKVDSVLRGNIIEETELIKSTFGLKRTILIPANPERKRYIRDGKYWIDETLLHETDFAFDPTYPTETSEIKSILFGESPNLTYVHIDTNSDLPSADVITGEISSKQDIININNSINQFDLCAGAADFFEVFLESKGFRIHPSVSDLNIKTGNINVILNGSSTWKKSREWLLTEGYKILPLPLVQINNEINVNQSEWLNWENSIIELLSKKVKLAVIIDLPVINKSEESLKLESLMNQVVSLILDHFQFHEIQFGITGGATASFIVRNQLWNELEVIKELIPGVVVLSNAKGISLTVKPGSYPWPHHI